MSKRPESFSDLRLIQSISKGDIKAFDEVFRKYYAPLCQYAIRWLRDPSSSEEVVQEVFIYLWEKRAQIRINRSLEAYLHTAVKNKSLNYLRKRMDEDIDKLSSPPSLLPDAESNLNEEALKNLISTGIEQLPNRCKVIFKLSRDAGLSYKEISESLDISVKTVEAQMSIALKRLKAFLGTHWESLSSAVLLFIIQY